MTEINPRITLQNLEGHAWRVTLEMQDMGDGQSIAFTLLVSKQDVTVGQLQNQALKQARDLIGSMLMGEGTPYS